MEVWEDAKTDINMFKTEPTTNPRDLAGFKGLLSQAAPGHPVATYSSLQPRIGSPTGNAVLEYIQIGQLRVLCRHANGSDFNRHVMPDRLKDGIPPLRQDGSWRMKRWCSSRTRTVYHT